MGVRETICSCADGQRQGEDHLSIRWWAEAMGVRENHLFTRWCAEAMGVRVSRPSCRSKVRRQRLSTMLTA